VNRYIQVVIHSEWLYTGHNTQLIIVHRS